MAQEPISAAETPAAARAAHRRRFNLVHSLAGVALLLGIEAALASLFDLYLGNGAVSTAVVLIAAAAGGLGVILAATEVIREVRNARHMLVLLSAIVVEFIIFFSFQYWFLSLASPGSFHMLPLDPVSMLLNSTMTFALNPVYMPENTVGRLLLLVNTIETLVLVLFVFQNIWQLHDHKEIPQREGL